MHITYDTFNGYQKQSYIAIQEHQDTKEAEMHWALGLGEEAGEVLGVIKHKYYGGKYELEDIVGELGDTLWYLAAICTTLGIDMQDVAKYNMAKLKHRYPEGTFDYDRSRQRHELDNEVVGDKEAIMEIIKSKLEEKQNEKI